MSGTPTPAATLSDPAFRNLTDDLRLAHLLADDADSITMNRFKALDLHVVAKPDLTPVSDADTAVEEALRRTLGRPDRATPCTGRRWPTPAGARDAG